MSFTGFLQIVNAPSRWWRRGHSFRITIWPEWLAQRLCPHQSKVPFSVDGKSWRCDDCFKFHLDQSFGEYNPKG